MIYRIDYQEQRGIGVVIWKPLKYVLTWKKARKLYEHYRDKYPERGFRVVNVITKNIVGESVFLYY